MIKKLLLLSARPARALYQETKAVKKPKRPPALVIFAFAVPVASWYRYPIPSSKKVISRKKKRRKNATVDLRVQNRRTVVKMNQPYLKKGVRNYTLKKKKKKKKNYKQEESE